MRDFWFPVQPIRRRLIEQEFPAAPPRRGVDFDLITRSPIAAYRFQTGWELLDEHDYYPEEYLANLHRCGINGVWVAGMFRTLIASKVLAELGPARHRLEKLQALAKKAARYGIKVWLFCMEPRPVRADHRVLAAHPEVRGAKVDEGEYCLCTSTPLVQEYLREIIFELLKAVPELGGLISIFNGERITNCWLAEEYARTCPRCSQREQVDVLAEELNCYIEGIERSGTAARFLAWNYWMDPADELKTHSVGPVLELIEKASPRVLWLGNFEHGGSQTIGGRTVPVDEYSLSFVGPGEPFVRIARKCIQTGRSIYAKLQAATTFELSTVPYLPVPGIVFDKLQRLKDLGGSGAMLNWIPGGFPSLMLRAAGEAIHWKGNKSSFLHHLARLDWDESAAESVVAAWEAFEQGLKEYPFTNRLFYFGPITRAPAYPLRLESEPNRAHPYNWGIDRNRQRQPYEEQIERWTAPFTVEQVITQLERMGAYWDEGLALLRDSCRVRPADPFVGSAPRADQFENGPHRCGPYKNEIPQMRHYAVAAAAGEHWLGARNVLEFLQARNVLRETPPQDRPAIIARLKQIVESQVASAQRMIKYIAIEPTIGFQSEILAFSYDRPMLQEAIEINQQTLQTLNGPMELILEALARARPIIDRPPDVIDVDHNGD